MSYEDDIKLLRRRIRRAHSRGWVIRDDAPNILRHTKRHGIKKALVRMCVREDALTIGEALLRTSSERIIHALAAVLAKE